MSHETCETCDKPLRLCECTSYFDGHTYIGPTDCAFCGETLDDAEEQGPAITRASTLVDDVRDLNRTGEDWEMAPGPREHTPNSYCIFRGQAFEARTPEQAIHLAAAFARRNA